MDKGHKDQPQAEHPAIEALSERLVRQAATRRRFLKQAGAAGVVAAALYAAPKVTSIRAVENHILTPKPPNGGPFCDPAINLIQNGSFEQDQNVVINGPGFITLGVGNPSITGWTIESGALDWIGSRWQSSDGVRNLDMNACQPASISQVISTTPGQMYRVSFDMAGNPEGGPAEKTMQIEIEMVQLNLVGSYSFNTTGKTGGNMGWLPKTFDFVATLPQTKIKFTSTVASDCYGPALDNVRVNCLLPD